MAKIADLEDRSRQNNIKFKDIPELIKSAELTTYLQHLFLKLLPHLTTADLTKAGAQKVPKPDITKNVLMGIFQCQESNPHRD